MGYVYVVGVAGLCVAGVLERGVVVLEVTGVDQCVGRCSKRILCM